MKKIKKIILPILILVLILVGGYFYQKQNFDKNKNEREEWNNYRCFLLENAGKKRVVKFQEVMYKGQKIIQGSDNFFDGIENEESGFTGILTGNILDVFALKNKKENFYREEMFKVLGNGIISVIAGENNTKIIEKDGGKYEIILDKKKIIFDSKNPLFEVNCKKVK